MHPKIGPYARQCGLSVLLAAFALTHAGCHRGPPETARHAVTNEYHGIQVVDDYQWLERSDDPAVRKWSAGQDKHARALLDKVPVRRDIEARLQQLYDKSSANYYDLCCRSGHVFALKSKPLGQQPSLVWLDSPNDLNSERVVVDPSASDKSGTAVINWYVPSRDGKLVAVSLSRDGSEQGSLSIYEVETGKKLPDEIPRVHLPTAGGSAAWNTDGTGLFYTRYPQPNAPLENGPEKASKEDANFYQRVYFHKIGAPTENDSYEVGKEFPRIAEVSLKSSEDGRYVLASVANGHGGQVAHHLRQPDGQWQQVTRFEDKVKQIEFGRDPLYIELPKDNALYLLSFKNASRGRILRLPIDQIGATPTAATNTSAPQQSGTFDLSKAKEIIAQGTLPIANFKPAATGIYFEELDRGPSQLRYFDFFDERRDKRLPVKGLYSVRQMLTLQGDELLFCTVSFTEPFLWSTYNPNKERDPMRPTALRGTAPADFDDIEVVREFVKSKDGARVPLNIIRRRGTRLEGQIPTLLTGYGSFGVSLTPDFDFTRRVWLDQGGIIAVANLRGGGEGGENWHQGGALTNKQHVFDDFIACARFLIRSNYTSPDKLAIEGVSNGGVLMGTVLTQHPELFRAVVSHVGIYDMLRAELDPNGTFSTAEFGSVQDAAQFEALFAYSPYHHVSNNVPYPSVLMLASAQDARVNPAHSRKMVARLQEATRNPQSETPPILLRTSVGTSHGMRTLSEMCDVFSFLFDQLGISYSLVERGPWSGGVTPHSAIVKAKMVRPLEVRLLVSTVPTFKSRVAHKVARASTNQNNVVEFSITGLKPDTQYYYALEVNRRMDKKKIGAFRTFPDRPSSFSFAYASCARSGSTSDVFDAIREDQPLFYMNIGDFHYLNITTNDRARFRSAYDLVLASPQQADLYRAVPFIYIWDDHDFGGNNSNRKASSHEAARLTYEEYVPHYVLASGEGDVPIYQSFSVGRAKFILTDLRSERDEARKRDTPQKSMMGAKQKQWFKQELLSAKDEYPLIFWVSSVPWLGDAHTNYYRGVSTNAEGFIHHTNVTVAMRRSDRNRGPGDEDHWSVYSNERREIADFIKSNHISGVCILHGDAHMLAADDGSHSDFATGGGAPIPVMCAAPLDQDASIKGGLYSQGIYKAHKHEGAFGFVTVTDRGSTIDVSYSGRNNKNQEKISLKFSVPATNHGARPRT